MLDIAARPATTDPAAVPAGVLALAVGPDGPVLPSGHEALLDESGLAAVRAFVPTPPPVGTVRELPLPGRTPSRVLLVSLGRAAAGAPATGPDGADGADGAVRDARRTGAALARAAGATATLTVAADLQGEPLAALAEGLALAAYRFTGGRHETPAEGEATPPVRLARVELAAPGDVDGAVATALATADAVGWARDVVNTRNDTKHPAWLADRAVALLQPLGVRVEVRDEAWLEREGFGGVLAVGKGSDTPPRLVEAHWRPEGAPDAPVLVVGKGITYDTGGYNLKPGASMATMYTDMAGGAAALAALAIVARAQLPVAVSVLVPMADNAVSGRAGRPGDIVTHRGGRTSEITNTDAEGRLVMADALAYGVETLDPRLVVDIATLTGAMMAALGDRIAGVIGDDDVLVEALVAAGEVTAERLWRMPLGLEEYGDTIDSPVADAVNSAAGGPPGAITAGLFLRPFAGGRPWAHLDIAGTARAKADSGFVSQGATGFGARLLAAWLRTLA